MEIGLRRTKLKTPARAAALIKPLFAGMTIQKETMFIWNSDRTLIVHMACFRCPSGIVSVTGRRLADVEKNVTGPPCAGLASIRASSSTVQIGISRDRCAVGAVVGARWVALDESAVETGYRKPG